MDLTIDQTGLDDPHLAAAGSIGGGQLGDLIGHNHGGQFSKLADIASGQGMFLHGVGTLFQIFDDRNALGIRGHRADKGITLEYIEPHTCDGQLRQGICLDNPDAALGRLILNGDGIGLAVLIGFNAGRETAIDVGIRSLRLRDGIDTIRKPTAGGSAILAGNQLANDNSSCVGNRKLRTRQHFAGYGVGLDDLDFALGGHVGGMPIRNRTTETMSRTFDQILMRSSLPIDILKSHSFFELI